MNDNPTIEVWFYQDGSMDHLSQHLTAVAVDRRRPRDNHVNWNGAGWIIGHRGQFWLIKAGSIKKGWKDEDVPEHMRFDTLDAAIAAGRLVL